MDPSIFMYFYVTSVKKTNSYSPSMLQMRQVFYLLIVDGSILICFVFLV